MIGHRGVRRAHSRQAHETKMGSQSTLDPVYAVWVYKLIDAARRRARTTITTAIDPNQHQDRQEGQGGLRGRRRLRRGRTGGEPTGCHRRREQKPVAGCSGAWVGRVSGSSRNRPCGRITSSRNSCRRLISLGLPGRCDPDHAALRLHGQQTAGTIGQLDRI